MTRAKAKAKAKTKRASAAPKRAGARSAPQAKKFGKVAVMLGGRSAEREISLISGKAVLQALRASGVNAHPFDPKKQGFAELIKARFQRVFIILHGRYGEDGTMQGALEQIGLPYTGSGVLASALAMDKWRTKLIWQQLGIPTPRSRLLTQAEDLQPALAELGLPLIIKPVREGSTIGLTKVTQADQLAHAFELARKFDVDVLAEQFIEGMELTASILGEQALPLIHIEAAGGLYDYHAKYFSEETQYHCPCGLPPRQEAEIQALALRAFTVLGCHGWGRVDLILDQQGRPWFLEVNTAPGMTSHSLVPMAAKASGISFEALVLRILELARAA